MNLKVDPPPAGTREWSIIVPEDRADFDLDIALEAAVSEAHGAPVQLWIREVDPEADTVADALGFRHSRDLLQLRCPLPNAPSGLITRGFRSTDLDDFIAVNNRAFEWHPEQGGLTREAVEATMAEPWFDPDGFRLFHHDNSLVGFCWTKIHSDHDPPLGEIYVIAVDPSHHGRGLGKPMTLAGLEWLTAQGLEHAMLYVESDNRPANAVYEALGFRRHHTDRAYSRPAR